MRNLPSACAVAVAAATTSASLLLVSPLAYAAPPGDNGTVKIHDAVTHEELKRNEPHVCGFYLDAFGFDGRQQVAWKIVEMPPTGTKDTEAESGTLVLDDEGHGRSTDLTLPDGHYKLVWNFDEENGEAKHKVFWSECASQTPSPTTSGEASPSTSPEPTDTPSETQSSPGTPTEPTDTPSETQSSPGTSTSPASAPSATSSPSGGSSLAETGAGLPVGAFATAAAALLGTGGYLVLRRRKAGIGRD